MTRDITQETQSQEGREVSEKQLKSFVERLERLEEEKAEIADGFKEVLLEAKSAGFEPKILRLILKRRKINYTPPKERRWYVFILKERRMRINPLPHPIP